MPQEIVDQLSRLSELTGAEIAALQKSILKEFDTVDKIKEKSAADIELMNQLVEANDTVIAENDNRAAANAEAETRAEELRAKMHPVEGDTPLEGVDLDIADNADADAAGDGEEGDGIADAAGGLPIAAGATRLPSMQRLNRNKNRAPAAPVVHASTRTVAQYQSSGLKMGDRITSPDQLWELMTDKINQLARVRGTGEKHVVASIFTDYPDERKLTMDAGANEHKIRAVTDPQAITASGGVCGPVAVDYDILVLSSTQEPLGDSLPKFNADRGGLRYIQPPSFAGVGSTGTTVWTEATDLSPGGLTKPIQTIACGNVVETYVNAIPTRLKFGNMQGRYFPELIAANTELALANAARVKELNRLSTISANSTLVSSGQLLGASRDILATVDQVAAAMRYRSRLDRTVQLHAILPDWAKDMFRADLTREQAHAQEPGWNSLGLSDQEITALFDARGINITWMLDGQAAVTAAPAQGFQGWGAQTPNATLQNWPTTLTWWLFPEGTFQLIDGGQMDFGVIRDSVLDATNDYETMIEVFENVIYRGFESLEVVSAVRPNGASGGNVVTATSPSIY